MLAYQPQWFTKIAQWIPMIGAGLGMYTDAN